VNQQEKIASLTFSLQAEDGWPPVASESLPFEETSDGYVTLSPPLFVKDLSVGDVIAAQVSPSGRVESWRHVRRSARTTIWLLRLRATDQIDITLSALRGIGCNTTRLDSCGSSAIDIPEDVPIWKVDEILARLDADNVAVAFPSMRHAEPAVG